MNTREIQAFRLAPVAASAIALVAFATVSQFVIVTLASYVAALILGRPLYLAFRRRAWPLGGSCLAAGVIAGAVTGVALTAALLVAISPERAMSNPSGFAFFTSLGLAVGAGFGIVTGAALWGLLSSTWESVCHS